MRIVRNGVPFVIVLALCWNAAPFQTPNASNLKGIHSVNLLVDRAKSNPCGISEDDITTSVKFILGQSSLHITEAHSPFIGYVNLNIMEDCHASSVSVQLLEAVYSRFNRCLGPDCHHSVL